MPAQTGNKARTWGGEEKHEKVLWERETEKFKRLRRTRGKAKDGKAGSTMRKAGTGTWSETVPGEGRMGHWRRFCTERDSVTNRPSAQWPRPRVWTTLRVTRSRFRREQGVGLDDPLGPFQLQVFHTTFSPMIHSATMHKGSEENTPGRNGRRAAGGKAEEVKGERSRAMEGLALLVLSIRL